jgi:transposase InsO family protein
VSRRAPAQIKAERRRMFCSCGEVMLETTNAYETGSELRAGLGRWLNYYNTERPHSGLAGPTPAEVYGQIGASSY